MVMVMGMVMIVVTDDTIAMAIAKVTFAVTAMASDTSVGMVVIMIMGADDIAGDIVYVVMVMGIDAKRRDPGFRKQRQVFRIFGNIVRGAGAANMVVETDHPVGRRHHQMQIMTDH